jgi:hypothetical protein
MSVSAAEQKGWLMLSQQNRPVGKDDPKLPSTLTFHTLACLKSWTLRAILEVPKLQEKARGARSRGMIESEKVSGLFI